jgi:hypothetical protein
MRRVVACMLGVALALMAAGCNWVQDRDYYREGIGSDLNSASLAEATAVLEQYITFICEQAAIPDPAQTCNAGNLPPAGWAEFVQAGMNDVDRRCDAYLVWLDDKRRSREPIIKQFQDTSAATQAIMRLSGVGADAITMAGVAFGFAQNTFTNVNSRLLTEIDKSTVQSVVLNEQNDFRRGLSQQTIRTRSEAIYALRSYLRLCMPYTIETQINTKITFVEQGGTPGGDNKLVDPGTVGITTVRMALPAAPPLPPTNVMSTALTALEKTIPKQPDAVNIQTGLGIANPDGEFGDKSSPTRAALKQFESGYWRMASLRPPKPPFNPTTITGTIGSQPERSAIGTFASAVRTCGRLPFKSNYEAGAWVRITPPFMAPLLRQQLDKAKAAGKLTTVPTIANVPHTICKVEDDVRAAIAVLKTAYGLPNTDDITDDLLVAFGKGP